MSVDMEKYFINPYNFVRYTKSGKKVCSAMGDDKKTGVILCRLKIATPLAIPDTAAKETDYLGNTGHNAYPFFSVDGKPVIPGSELRGLIRNVYETITDSCFSVINNNILTARTSNANNPGILYFDGKNNKWVLKSASKKSAYTDTMREILDKKYPEAVKRDWTLSVQLSTNMQRLKNGIDDRLRIAKNYEEFKESLGKNRIDGKDYAPITLIEVSEENGEKSVAYIFSSKKTSKEKNNKMNSVKIEKKWGEQYSDENILKYFDMDENERKLFHKRNYSEKIINHSVFIPERNEDINSEALENAVAELNLILNLYYEYSNRDEKMKVLLDKVRPSTYSSGIPVFYRKYGDKILLAPAQMSREVYDKRIHDFLGSYSKCETVDSLCPACSLFGVVSENSMAVSSRIRFSDAKSDDYIPSNDYVPLKILSTPKTTAYEFYATEKYSEDGAMLRGRKFYLHNPMAKTSEEPYRQRSEENATDKSRKERSDLNASMKLLKYGTFEFKIYFDGISEKELKNLILSLNLGENSEDGKYMHKLGHGKPLGLGSVKIWVKEVKFRTIVENTYTLAQNEEFNRFLDMLATGSDDGNPLAVKAKVPSAIAEKQKGVKTDYIFADEDTLRDLLYICDFEHCKDFTVSYPIITGSGNANDTASHRFFTWIRDASSIGKNKSSRSKEGQKYKALPFVSDKADYMKLPILKAIKKEKKVQVVALDDTLNAVNNISDSFDKKESGFDGEQSSSCKKKSDYGKKNPNNGGTERFCSICGNAFFTKYEGKYPKCSKCLKNSKNGG